MEGVEFFRGRVQRILADPAEISRYIECRPNGDLYWKARAAEDFPPSARSWEFRRWNAKYAGRPALNSRSHGYRKGAMLGGTFAAHRVVFAMTHGFWPDNVDHINGDRADNRPENLRSVTRSGNAKNMGLSRRNTSGFSGVSFYKAKQKWMAKARISGRQKALGFFSKIEDAIAAVAAARLADGFHPNHGKARP